MSGAANLIANYAPNNIGIINAGDGSHAHPTQALVDAFTVSKKFKNLNKLKLAIVGDILHSRVARSQIDTFKKIGISDIRLMVQRLYCQLNSKNLVLVSIEILKMESKTSMLLFA